MAATTLLSLDTLLPQYGIAVSSLQPEVRTSLETILKTAGKAALEQFLVILEQEARKRGVNTDGTTPGGSPASTQNDAAKAALDEQERKENQKKIFRTLGYIVASLVLIGGLAFFFTRKKKSISPTSEPMVI